MWPFKRRDKAGRHAEVTPGAEVVVPDNVDEEWHPPGYRNLTPDDPGPVTSTHHDHLGSDG